MKKIIGVLTKASSLFKSQHLVSNLLGEKENLSIL